MLFGSGSSKPQNHLSTSFLIEMVDPGHGNEVRLLILERIILDDKLREVSEVH